MPEYRSFEQCRGSVGAVSGQCWGSVGAVSGQCRGSVRAVSGQCRGTVSEILDSGPPWTASSSVGVSCVGVSGIRVSGSVGCVGCVGVSECRSVETLPYELADPTSLADPPCRYKGVGVVSG